MALRPWRTAMLCALVALSVSAASCPHDPGAALRRRCKMLRREYDEYVAATREACGSAVSEVDGALDSTVILLRAAGTQRAKSACTAATRDLGQLRETLANGARLLVAAEGMDQWDTLAALEYEMKERQAAAAKSLPALQEAFQQSDDEAATSALDQVDAFYQRQVLDVIPRTLEESLRPARIALRSILTECPVEEGRR
jgi:hypothetical protein